MVHVRDSVVNHLTFGRTREEAGWMKPPIKFSSRKFNCWQWILTLPWQPQISYRFGQKSLFDIIFYFFQFSSSDCRNSGYAFWRDVALMFGISWPSKKPVKSRDFLLVKSKIVYTRWRIKTCHLTSSDVITTKKCRASSELSNVNLCCCVLTEGKSRGGSIHPTPTSVEVRVSLYVRGLIVNPRGYISFSLIFIAIARCKSKKTARADTEF